MDPQVINFFSKQVLFNFSALLEKNQKRQTKWAFVSLEAGEVQKHTVRVKKSACLFFLVYLKPLHFDQYYISKGKILGLKL